jgi:serine/threonine-protein kinase
MALSAGDRLGPYELLSPLGEGGMGEVWKAHDTRLGRIVAIKRLKDGYSDRFKQEALAIAAVNHPNICQIHDVGPDYLVLEYINGQPLHGPMAAEEAVRLAIQIAAALEEAHSRGILHRDLKPGNILVTAKGIAKLLDFGLAKPTAPAGSDITRTFEGLLVGTVAYMAPEQAQGKPLDERSDIFSFGAVLYEMISGRRAFTGDSAADVLSAVLRDQPPPLQAPAALERVVMRCLEKSQGGRFQTVAELQAALRQTDREPEASRPSIAVLPFDNMSGDKDNEYFSDGLAEEIISALAQIAGLKVIARTSAFAFKGRHEDIRRIAEALGVAHVLEGSVRRAGNRIRVAAQLISATDGSHLWSGRYDREMADVFDIQDEIAHAIVETLRVKLSRGHAAHRRHAPNLPAYEAFLRARYDSLDNYSPEASARCTRNYQEAIALDSQFALAHAELGIHFLTRALPGIAPAREVMPLARAAALRALDLDPSLPEAHAALGAAAGVYEFDWRESERQFGLALARDPVPPSVRFLYGMFYLLPVGRWREAAAEHERGLEDDPLSFSGRLQLAMCFMQTNRFVEAEMEFRKVMKSYESAFQPRMFLALAFAAQEKLTEAVTFAEQAYSLAPWHSHSASVLAGLLVRAGNLSRAEELIRKLGSPQTYGVPTAMTFFHLLCGELNSATEWSEKAIEQRDPRMVLGMQLPMAAAFRADPRGRAILRKMNLPEAG